MKPPNIARTCSRASKSRQWVGACLEPAAGVYYTSAISASVCVYIYIYIQITISVFIQFV